jgi:Putative  PD-(D/E)XK family member, (DUF4420)
VILSEDLWQSLSRAESNVSGLAVRRLFPQQPLDLFAALSQPESARMLLLELRSEGLRLPDLPKTRAIEVRSQTLESGSRIRLSLVLVDRAFSDVFTTLVADIAEAVAATTGPEQGMNTFFLRIGRWRHLLDSIGESGLGETARRGLFGELWTMLDLLVPALTPSRTVVAWTGPEAANQDFQLPFCAVEVKATAAKKPQTLTITNERELDATGTPRLFLVYVSLDERRGGTGRSLNDIVDALGEALAGDPAASALFRDKLHRIGYLEAHHHLYDEPRYTVRGHQAFDVTGDFPRITERDLRPGVGDVRYRLELAACSPYEATMHDLQDSILRDRP